MASIFIAAGGCIGTQESAYVRDPNLPTPAQQRDAALEAFPKVIEQLRSAGAVPLFAHGEYHECSGAGNEERWPVDGATWSYGATSQVDPPQGVAGRAFLAEIRPGLKRLRWVIVRNDAHDALQASRGDLTLRIHTEKTVRITVSGPCASVSQRQHVEYGMGYRDDFLVDR
ncbi:MAG: hypothetical protein GEV03_19620 [Streptosporangiales bacterium]|nr:hypothetical protein [Streptosporangiales bacterium]